MRWERRNWEARRKNGLTSAVTLGRVANVAGTADANEDPVGLDALLGISTGCLATIGLLLFGRALYPGIALEALGALAPVRAEAVLADCPFAALGGVQALVNI